MHWIVIFGTTFLVARASGPLDNPYFPWRSSLEIPENTKKSEAALCKLPPYPERGSYVVVDAPGAGPGDLYQNVSIVQYVDNDIYLNIELLRCSAGHWTEYIFEYNSEKIYFNSSWCPLLCPGWADASKPSTTTEATERLEFPAPNRCKVPNRPDRGSFTIRSYKPGKTFNNLDINRYALDETNGVYEIIGLTCSEGIWKLRFFRETDGEELTFFQNVWCPYLCQLPMAITTSEPPREPYLSNYNVPELNIQNQTSCELPPYPEGGNYTAVHRPEAVPGDVTRAGHLSFACHGNRRLVGSKHVYCVEGVWSDIPPICLSCGRIRSFALEPTSAEDAARKEVPWHVAVYDKTRGHEHVCSGSIIAANLIITAAHCLWDESEGPRPAAHFAVAAGKAYGDWNSPQDEDAQKRDASKIVLHSLFRGKQTNYQNNIAVIYLDAPLNFTDYVTSICLDFDLESEEKQLIDGNFGKIAGWVSTSTNDTDISKLKVDWMPYIDTNKCISTSSPDLLQYVTSDKICAGDIEGTALCRSDGGASLSYQERDENRARVSYLRGVASLANAHDSTCDNQPVTVYTHVLHHEDFINANLKEAIW